MCAVECNGRLFTGAMKGLSLWLTLTRKQTIHLNQTGRREAVPFSAFPDPENTWALGIRSK